MWPRQDDQVAKSQVTPTINLDIISSFCSTPRKLLSTNASVCCACVCVFMCVCCMNTCQSVTCGFAIETYEQRDLHTCSAGPYRLM
ncbi:unnamed protein product [Protopolystoma xenopodis]|uniref:Uncharacterized protein n=1 Tax=Protopolystoma xenopodis TaxID=117903 RepID=A0A3S5FG15_9PLAT|nr:unnamed protein product [Protopolystoma xenopodis]